jgi:hypothetical protein
VATSSFGRIHVFLPPLVLGIWGVTGGSYPTLLIPSMNVKL